MRWRRKNEKNEKGKREWRDARANQNVIENKSEKYIRITSGKNAKREGNFKSFDDFQLLLLDLCPVFLHFNIYLFVSFFLFSFANYHLILLFLKFMPLPIDIGDLSHFEQSFRIIWTPFTFYLIMKLSFRPLWTLTSYDI